MHHSWQNGPVTVFIIYTKVLDLFPTIDGLYGGEMFINVLCILIMEFIHSLSCHLQCGRSTFVQTRNVASSIFQVRRKRTQGNET